MSLLIFDCDGTLVDTEHLHEAAVVQAFLGFGIDLTTLGNFRARFGGTIIRHIHTTAEAETGQRIPFAPLLAAIHAHTAALLADPQAIQPVPGIHAALTALRTSLPWPRCVASNGNRAVVLHSLRATGLAAAFTPLEASVFTACQVARSKPFPDLFLHAAATHGTPPERCVVIEDSAAGVQAAKAAGMRVIGYTGVSPLPDPARYLQEAGADMILADYAALPGVLESLTAAVV